MATKTNYKEVSHSQGSLKGKNLAFLDAEYLCARFKKGSIEDVISIGAVITGPDFVEQERYYSTVQLSRGHHLTPLIVELTGLTDDMLINAPSYTDVMGELIGLLKRQQVGRVLVWGGDKSSFQKDLDSRSLDKNIKKEIQKFINSFENIQKEVSMDITEGIDTGLSLADLKTICGLGGNVEHNALSDAVDMLDCIRIISEGRTVYSGVEAGRYKKFRGEYVKNRSFDDDEEDSRYKISSEIGKKFLEELRGMGFEENPKTKAFMDDLEFLLGEGNRYMGTFAEMKNEENN